MPSESRKVIFATALGAVVLGTAAQASFVFIPDGDTATLVSLLANAMEQLNTLNEQLGAVKKTYAETKKYVGYAEDSVNAFERLSHWDTNQAVQLLEDAVPNLRYFDREAHHLNTWTQGRHELDVLVSACLRAKHQQASAMAQGQVISAHADDACGALDNALTGQQVAQTIVTTFGPPKTPRQVRLDAAAADALTDFEVIRILDQKLKDQWDAYEKYCLEALADASGPGDVTDSVMSRCQAAQAAVQVGSARQLQMLRREVVRLKEIEALRLANDNARDKDQQSAHDREQQQLIDGARGMVPPDIQINGPGFNILQDN